MTSGPVHRRVAHIAIALSLLIGLWSSPAFGAAIVTTAFGANDIVIYPTPNADLPNPAAITVSGLPADARPQGVSCFDDTCLVSDSGHFRVFVVRVSTASVIDTIDTAAGPYTGAGTLAVNPARSHALALDPFVFAGRLTVIHAPFASGATITTVLLPPGSVQTGGTQSVVFGPDGRAFVCAGGLIAVFDPPYTGVAFTMALPTLSGCGDLAITPSGGVLLAPFSRQVNIFTAPFTPASTAAVLSVPEADVLAGAAVTSDAGKALVVDVSGESLWAISAPFNAGSAVERIALPPVFPAVRQIAISPDNELAIVAGGGGTNPRTAFVRRPFTAAEATAFDVFIEGGLGFGGVNFLGPAGPPGPPPPPCGPIPASAAVLNSIDPRVTAANGPVPLVAAILPSSRSVRVGCPATAFVTVINAGTETATAVGISPATPVPVDFLFQTTDPATNTLTGTPNTPANIGAGQSQTFVIALTPRAAIDPTDVAFNFGGTNTAPVQALVGLNTLLLSASTSNVPDIVALAATQGNNGIVDLPSASNVGAFAVASVNVGLGAPITVSADTGGVPLPLAVFVCETNAQGGCLANPAPSVTTFIDGSATPTFAFFVIGQGAISFDPAANRIFVRFRDGGGVTRGSTSVAVRTTP